MKNLLIVMAILCVGMFGFAGTALAGNGPIELANVGCDDKDTFCLDGKYYEAKLKCDGLEAAIVTDSLIVDSDGDYWVDVVDANGTVVDAHGSIFLKKTEGETESDEADSPDADDEVEWEIKWKSDTCP